MMLRSITLLALLLSLTALADTFTGKVVKVTDGDVLHVRVTTTWLSQTKKHCA